jgi:hypothetical protein
MSHTFPFASKILVPSSPEIIGSDEDEKDAPLWLCMLMMITVMRSDEFLLVVKRFFVENFLRGIETRV